MKVPRIEGKKLYLRELSEEDIPQMLVWMNNIEITQYLELDPPITEVQEKEWLIEMNRSSTDLVLGIVEKDSNTYMGNIGIHNISSSSGTANVGIFIGNPNQRGRGYGSEAVALATEFACKNLNIRVISANIFTFNTISISLFENLGFKRTGATTYLKNDARIDTEIYSFICKGSAENALNSS